MSNPSNRANRATATSPNTLARHVVFGALTACALLASTATQAQQARWTYEVKVTNLTANQRFTPLLIAAHDPALAFFQLGQPASAGLTTLAEEGNVAPLKASLDSNAQVSATVAGNALLDPGKTVTFQIQANPKRDRLSLSAMLIPTNDAFVALNGVMLPWHPYAVQTHIAIAYDAGTEVNDERCTSIPGPFFAECNGPGGGARVGGGEGFVHVHRGVHGVGDLIAGQRDWRNPVAQVQIRLVR